jgi:Raf kinase inhibitor-like YbhB/YbcL family protein
MVEKDNTMHPSIVAAAALLSIAFVALCAKGAPKMSILVTSSAFADNQPIPRKYTGDGQDVSPPLAWKNLPAGTRELALVCDDPDAPTPEPWVHWVIYKIPADTAGLPENVHPQPKLAAPKGALQGLNSWTSGRTVGYRGPAPPPGKAHRYRFQLYALDAPLELPAEADKKALLRAIEGHVLAEGVLTGTYGR